MLQLLLYITPTRKQAEVNINTRLTSSIDTLGTQASTAAAFRVFPTDPGSFRGPSAPWKTNYSIKLRVKRKNKDSPCPPNRLLRCVVPSQSGNKRLKSPKKGQRYSYISYVEVCTASTPSYRASFVRQYRRVHSHRGYVHRYSNKLQAAQRRHHIHEP